MDEDRQFPLEGYRDELRLFCYRMGGSLQEAEGSVGEALFRSGGLPLPFTDTGSMRTELFKIAARLCMEALADQPPRTLPRLSNLPCDPRQPPLPQGEGELWLEPFPDDLYHEPGYGGRRSYSERESVSLTFVTALQSLRPRERMCLILGDVMYWKVETLAEVLGSSTADTRVVMEEARASMDRVYEEGLGMREPPAEEKTAELMMRYLFPWETGDVEALAERLSDDAVLQLPPSPSWYEGRDAVKKHLASYALQGDASGRWRLLPRRANGQLAFGVYRRDEERRIYAAHSVQVLHFTGELVSEITAFKYPWLFPDFKLLPEVAVQG